MAKEKQKRGDQGDMALFSATTILRKWPPLFIDVWKQIKEWDSLTQWISFDGHS